MDDVADDLEMLLSDVRRTISDNRLFLEKLVDETVEEDPLDEADATVPEEEFEEL
jgi:hypothetical protein